MKKEYLKIKSAAKTEKGIIKAIDKESDFFYGMDQEEKEKYVKDAFNDGSLEVTGKEIIIYELM